MIISAVLSVLFGFLLAKHFLLWKPRDVSHLYKNGPLMIGHRGSPYEAPENTVPSFLKSVESGLKAVEIDVICSRDGKVVCSHNYDLERETDGYGYIPDKTYQELIGINAGVKFPELSFCKLPLLEEVLDILPEDIIVNIEIKAETHWEIKTARLVVNIIRKRNLYGRVLVSSFHPLAIGLVKLTDKRIPTAYLWSDQDIVPDLLKKPRLINLVHPDLFHPEAHLVDVNLIRYARRKGFKVNVWTVNNLPAIKWLLNLGVDGIFSDFPMLMQKACL